QLFELRHRENVFLTLPPPLFDVFQRDVGGHAGGDGTDSVGHLSLVVQVGSGERENGEQAVDVDPRRARVVKRKVELDVFTGQGQPFDQAQLPVDAGEPTSPVLDSPRDNLRGERRSFLDVITKDPRIDVGAERVDVVDHQVL